MKLLSSIIYGLVHILIFLYTFQISTYMFMVTNHEPVMLSIMFVAFTIRLMNIVNKHHTKLALKYIVSNDDLSTLEKIQVVNFAANCVSLFVSVIAACLDRIYLHNSNIVYDTVVISLLSNMIIIPIIELILISLDR
jgi:hypothetical protein